MPQWQLDERRGYTVTGAPVLVEDLADALAGSTLRLLLVGVAGDGARARAACSAAGCGCCRWLVALARGGDHVRRDVAASARR